MKSKVRRTALWSIALLFLAVDAESDVFVEKTASMIDVERSIVAMGNKYGPKRVLVVFDVDNTLLVMPRDLGSVAWWRWQAGLLRKGKVSPQLVARDFEGLIQAQYVILSLANMKVTEQRVPAMVKNLAERGYAMMALTARGPEVQSITLRELVKAGIELRNGPSCGKKLCAGSGLVSAGNVLAAAKSFYGPKKLREYRFTDWVMPIGFAGGVLSVSGQHKGALLMLLLDSAPGKSYAAIVFVDDDAKNVEHVRRAYDARDIDVRAIHYTRYEANVRAFAKDRSRQRRVSEAWVKTRTVLCDVFRRFC